MQATIEQIEREVKQLSAEDLRKVRELVNSLLEKKNAKPAMTEEEFERHLYEKGIIGEVKPPVTDFAPYENYKPITVAGEPVSETIIRERG